MARLPSDSRTIDYQNYMIAALAIAMLLMSVTLIKLRYQVDALEARSDKIMLYCVHETADLKTTVVRQILRIDRLETNKFEFHK